MKLGVEIFFSKSQRVGRFSIFHAKLQFFFLLFYVKKKIAPIKNKKIFFQFLEQLGALFKKMTYFLVNFFVNFLAFFHAKLQLFAGLGGLFE